MYNRQLKILKMRHATGFAGVGHKCLQMFAFVNPTGYICRVYIDVGELLKGMLEN